jgi:hypothetical protein
MATGTPDVRIGRGSVLNAKELRELDPEWTAFVDEHRKYFGAVKVTYINDEVAGGPVLGKPKDLTNSINGTQWDRLGELIDAHMPKEKVSTTKKRGRRKC